MTVAGALLAVQTRVAGALGVEMGSALAASTVSFLVVVVRERAAVRRLRDSASMMVVAAPRVGVAVASVGSCTGMALGALGADRAGFGPAGRHRVTGRRLIGAALAVAAVAIAAGPASGDGQLLLLGLLVLAGVGAAFQQPVNGRLAWRPEGPLCRP